MATTVAQAEGAAGIAITSRRVIGLMGIIGVLMFLFTIFGLEQEAPGLDDPASEARTWWADNGEQFLIGDYISGIALVLFLVPFVVGLYGILSRAEGADPLGSRVMFAAFLLFLVAAIASTLSTGTLALGAEEIDSDGTIRAMQYMEFYAFSSGAPLTVALFFGGAAFAIARTGVMWRWLAWVAVPLAIVGIVGSAAPIDGDPEGVLVAIGFLATGGFLLWLLAAAINVLLSKPAEGS